MTASRVRSRLAWLLTGSCLLSSCSGPVGSSQPTITLPRLSATAGPDFQPPAAATLLPDEPPPPGPRPNSRLFLAAIIAVFWAPGAVSPLDAGNVAGGRDIGTANVFNRELAGKLRTFTIMAGRIVHESTGSTWNILGQASDGPLAGLSLTLVIAINHFWFSWAAFRPDTRDYRP